MRAPRGTPAGRSLWGVAARRCVGVSPVYAGGRFPGGHALLARRARRCVLSHISIDVEAGFLRTRALRTGALSARRRVRGISSLPGGAATYRASVTIPQGLPVSAKDKLTGILPGSMRTARAIRAVRVGRASGTRAAGIAVGTASAAGIALWIASLVGHGEHCTAKSLPPHLSRRVRERSLWCYELWPVLKHRRAVRSPRKR